MDKTTRIICGNKIIRGKSRKGRKYCSTNCNSKSYYQKNKKRCIENAKNWDKRNPEKRKEINKKGVKKFYQSKKGKDFLKRNYQKHKKKISIRNITNWYKNEIFKIKGKLCNLCGSKKNIEIHHLDYSWNKIGHKKNSLMLNIDTVEVLCRKCHRKKHTL